jgi:hypothetical protein
VNWNDANGLEGRSMLRFYDNNFERLERFELSGPSLN